MSRGDLAVSDIFIKLVRGRETEFLIVNHPNAFRLLSIIALRARREPNDPDGLKPGEAFIGDWKGIGMTRQEYRTALDILVSRCHIKIVETNRTRKKATTGLTTTGTKVMLISLNIYDVNLKSKNHPINHRTTTDQPLTNHKQERQERTKNVKKQQQQLPAVAEIYSCLKIPELEFSDQVSLMQTGMTERRMREGVAFARNKKAAGQIKTTFGACVGWYVRQDQFFPDLSEQMILAEKYLRELEAMRMDTAVQLNENFRDNETLFVLLKGKETRISLKDPPGLVESQINDCLREVKEKFRHKIVSLESEKDKNDLETQGNEIDIVGLP